jgi:predicted ATP-grasp superfamily ATP-dependent carboligase
MINKKTYSLVLGGYINGYSIIRELNEKGLVNIALFDYGKSLGSKSNKINHYQSIDKSSDSLKNAILKLKMECDYIVIFPTDDLQLENLYAIYEEIKEFCFVPFNYDNVIQSLDKYVQYSFCEKYDIPYPKTQNIEIIEDLNKIEIMMFPILIKPNKRDDITTDVFRSLFLENIEEYKKNKEKLQYFINKNITFLASEFIPGDDTNIYAYVGYRTQDGKILNEWIGKKLTQYPDNFGVFSSGSNEAPNIVKEQGRKLLEIMDLKGINEPEFKYDSRDGKYKLMEINLRSMMWHRVGNLSGVNIQYTQYLDAIGEEVQNQNQNQNDRVHFVYIRYEILNLLFRKAYWKHFKYNVFGTKRIEYAVYDKSDLKPFLYEVSIGFMKGFISQCLKVFKEK